MKKFILLAIVAMFATINVMATDSTIKSTQGQLVVITGVSCVDTYDGPNDTVFTENVHVELTDAGIRYMREYGYSQISVEISPKNSIWNFIIDTRKSKFVYLTIKKPYGHAEFKGTRNCGKNDFKIEDINYYR